jgi:hypothetical protein
MHRQENLTFALNGLSVSVTFIDSENTVVKTRKGVSIFASIPVSLARLKLSWRLVEKEENIGKLQADKDLIDQIVALPNIEKIRFVAVDEILIVRKDESIDWPPIINRFIEVLFQHEEAKKARISNALIFINSYFQDIDH